MKQTSLLLICLLIVFTSFSPSVSTFAKSQDAKTIEYNCGAFNGIKIEYSADGKTATLVTSKVVLTAKTVDSGIYFSDERDSAAIKGDDIQNIGFRPSKPRTFIKCSVVK